MQTEPVRLAFHALPASLGPAPTLPVYQQRIEWNGPTDGHQNHQLIFEAYLPANVLLGDIAYVQAVGYSHFHAQRVDIYLVEEVRHA